MLENNIPDGLLRRNGIIGILDVDRDIEVIEDTLEQSHRSDPFYLDVQETVDRHIHPSEESYEHRDVTDRDARIVLHHEDAACKIDEHRAYRRESREDHSEPSSGHALFDVETDHFAVGILVSDVLIFLLAEELYEELSADRQSLI